MNTTIARRQALAVLVISSSLAVVAAERDNADVLPEESYRLELEEVVVTGQAPKWREPEPSEWRPERFELPDESELVQPRMEWFPEYTRDERDNYDGVRDRMGEEAGIKIFEWRF